MPAMAVCATELSIFLMWCETRFNLLCNDYNVHVVVSFLPTLILTLFYLHLPTHHPRTPTTHHPSPLPPHPSPLLQVHLLTAHIDQLIAKVSAPLDRLLETSLQASRSTCSKARQRLLDRFESRASFLSDQLEVVCMYTYVHVGIVAD